nr:hypothetical protein [Tanacetum cinerariifolium]
MRIVPTKTPKEPTYKLFLDSLALSSLYPAFLITTKVPKNLCNNHQQVSIWENLGLDKIRLSRAQILWGMYYNKNVDFIELLWEDFMFQIDNKVAKKQEKMNYPNFTKAIIHHFISKDKSISMMNRIFMHTVRDDSVLGAATPKKARKFKRLAFPLKKKALVAVEEPVEKPAIKRIKRETNIYQPGGSSEGVDLESKGPVEPKVKSIDTSEGTCLKLGVLNVSKANSSESKYEYWGDNDDDDDDHQSDDESTDDEEDDEFVHNLDDYVPFDDENLDDEEYECINKEIYDDVNVELKDVDLANEEKRDEEMTHAENVNA